MKEEKRKKSMMNNLRFPFGGMSKSTEIMTVTPKDDEEEIKNERPESYHTGLLTEEKSAFEQAALRPKQIFRELSLRPH